MTFNSELAYQVLEQIKLHPEKHVQGDWRCGTGMCFAGWAAEIHGVRWLTDDLDSDARGYVVVTEDFLAEHDLKKKDVVLNAWRELADDTLEEGEVVVPVRVYARALLGLTEQEAGILFSYSNSRSAITKMIKAFESGDEELLQEALEIDTDFNDPAEYTLIQEEEE